MRSSWAPSGTNLNCDATEAATSGKQAQISPNIYRMTTLSKTLALTTKFIILIAGLDRRGNPDGAVDDGIFFSNRSSVHARAIS